MKLTMKLAAHSYDIIISRGALARLGQLTDLQQRRVMVLTDDGVPRQYSDTVLAQCAQSTRLVLAQGEQTKQPEAFVKVLLALKHGGFSRGDAVVAVGGGVVGDLAGFAAACYMRGIAFINCPTTTLSQMDSSVGGKTGINLENAKNMVGAFYQPQLVVIDPDTLHTLPPRHYANGMAEAVKAGLIGDKTLFEAFEQQALPDAEQLLHRAIGVKQRLVEQDERENGVRAALNFGHTLGHALEAACAPQLYHGECVALGMLPMLSDPRLQKRVRAVLERHSLLHAVPCNAQQIVPYLLHDKKMAGDRTVKTVRVDEPGGFRFEQASVQQLEQMVQRLLAEQRCGYGR